MRYVVAALVVPALTLAVSGCASREDALAATQHLPMVATRPRDEVACGDVASEKLLDDYRSLALAMVSDRAYAGVKPGLTSPQALARQATTLTLLRQEWVPTIQDSCLRSLAAYWLGFYDDEVEAATTENERLGDRVGPLARRAAAEEAARRDLAERLGLNPARP